MGYNSYALDLLTGLEKEILTENLCEYYFRTSRNRVLVLQGATNELGVKISSL